MADYNPFQGMLNPNMSRGANLWDLRMMSAANRMETPFERMAGRGGHTRSAVAGNPMLGNIMGTANEPDLSQFTFDPALRAQAQQLGVQPLEASQVRQNMILPNTGFFGSHPRLSRALEAGMFGTLAAHGGDTVGESIQGTMEGIIGGPRLREGMYREQFAKPFEAAGLVEGLKDQVQKRQLQEADIQHLRALNEHLIRGDAEKFQQLTETNRHNEAMEAMRGQQEEITRPVNLGEGRIGFFHPENVPEYGKPIDPSKPLWEIQQDPEWEKERAKDRNANLRPPHQLVAIPDGKGGVTYQEASPGKHFNTVPETISQAGGTSSKLAVARQQFVEKALKSPELMFQLRITPGDPNAAQKLGTWYDTNLSTPEAQGMMGEWLGHYGLTTGNTPPPGAKVIDMTGK